MVLAPRENYTFKNFGSIKKMKEANLDDLKGAGLPEKLLKPTKSTTK